MNYQQFVETLTPDVYEKLKQAVELGKWPDGKMLTAEQKQHCLQAIITYDLTFKQQQDRVGYIYSPKHNHCGNGLESATGGKSGNTANVTETVKWKD